MLRLRRGIGNVDPLHGDDLVLVSHDATRTGAPRVAIEILRSWTCFPGHRHAVLKGGGPLLAEFQASSDHLTMHSAPFRESLCRLGFKQARRGPYALAGRFDVIGARRVLRFVRQELGQTSLGLLPSWVFPQSFTATNSGITYQRSCGATACTVFRRTFRWSRFPPRFRGR